MLKRIITGVVAFALFLPILVFSGHEIGKYVFMAVIGRSEEHTSELQSLG